MAINVDIVIRYRTWGDGRVGYLCFKHAVLRAIAGEDVETVADSEEHCGEYGWGSNSYKYDCVDCSKE